MVENINWEVHRRGNENWVYTMEFYKITKIVRAFWLDERRVRMRICKRHDILPDSFENVL